MTSFIYPRTISVVRDLETGDMEYDQPNYQPVTGLSNLRASIQFKGNTGRPNTDLPIDPSNETYWAIFVPYGQGGGIIARGLILLSDKIISDLGEQYEVVAPYWNSLGYNLRCKLLAP